METLKIEKSEAKKIFKEGPEWLKKILTSIFGKEIFSEKITDRIKTFEDACNELCIDPEKVFNDSDSVDDKAYKKLKVIVMAINEGWEPDFNDMNQRKWFPYFTRSSGFGFSTSDYYFALSYSLVGSRLYLETEEKAIYVANQFLNIYEEYYNK